MTQGPFDTDDQHLDAKPGDVPAATEGPFDPAAESESEASMEADAATDDDFAVELEGVPEPAGPEARAEAEEPPAASEPDGEHAGAEEADDEEQPQAKGNGLPDLSGARVLVIEDETPVANFVTEFLHEAGAQVIQAADGARGLELFESESPDFVLCDLLLPKRNGFQLLEEMAEAAPDVPVVIMSGVYSSEKYRKELPHARAFLDKPIGVDDLLQVAELIAERVAERGTREEAEKPAPAPRARRRVREPWVPTRLVPLARMLHLLWKDRRSGLLTHRNGERQTVFLLKEGQVRFVRCNDPQLRLGPVLTQLGKVRAEDLDRARAALEDRTVPARLGEVLVELGVLGAPELRSAVQLQLRKIIAGAFGQAEGETLFREETQSSDEDIVIDVDTRAVIVAGCAAFRGDTEELLGHLPDGDCTVELTCEPGDPALKIPAAERKLLEAIEGPTRLAHVTAMAEIMGLRARPLVFGLLCAEVLALVESGAEWEKHAPRHRGVERSMDTAEPAALHLLRLETEKATGTLTVQLGDTQAWLAFEEGRLCSAGSGDARSRLGERLRRSGLVNDEQLVVALEVKSQCPRKPLGRILVEMGSLEPAQLLHAVRAQFLGIATDLLTGAAWESAQFEEGRLPDAEPIDLGLSTADVVLEGLRRLPSAQLERLAGALAQGRPELDLEALRSGRYSFNDTEESVVDALSQDVEGLLRSLTSADESDPDVLRMLVAGLLISPMREAVEAG